MSQCFVLVPTADITQAMINRSVVSQESDFPEVTHDSVQKYVVGIDKDDIKLTDIFDGYKWYSEEEIKEELS